MNCKTVRFLTEVPVIRDSSETQLYLCKGFKAFKNRSVPSTTAQITYSRKKVKPMNGNAMYVYNDIPGNDQDSTKHNILYQHMGMYNLYMYKHSQRQYVSLWGHGQE